MQKYEPWKIALISFIIGATLLGGGVALLHYIAPREPVFPYGTIITIPSAKP